MVDAIWYGHGLAARAARAVLRPVAALYAIGTGARNALYDAGVLPQHALPMPAVSVGNLSVGGTGKTPVAAWLVGELARRGAHPAVVLRGYGDDEPAVHRQLNPAAVVVASADRVAGVRTAARLGADVAVLDDAFQHRRARRDADVVLLSADRWDGSAHLLPAGPFREGLGALARASLVVITRKAVSPSVAAALRAEVAAAQPTCPVVAVHLAPSGLVDAATGMVQSLDTLDGRRVLAICGVGDPDAFAAQLAGAGAVVTLRAFRDHHAYTRADAAALFAEATDGAGRGGLVVCTLKDAVKLSPVWPSGKPGLSFLAQEVILESGRDTVDRLLDSLVHARRPAAVAAG